MEQNVTVPPLRLCPGLHKLDFTPREEPKPGLIKIIALVLRGYLTQLKSFGFNYLRGPQQKTQETLPDTLGVLFAAHAHL
ncbi:hypothetical protein CPC16_003293 [Podila verticillata]|nr:hypothetical protein CPC16_003293 [Podila verticillata]